jgi:hypothetical protein
MTDERLGEQVQSAPTARPTKAKAPKKAATRASKTTVNRRQTRASQNRQVTNNRSQADAVRMELFRQMHAQAALPNIPPIPGYHVCWLTTTNNKDSIAMRVRLGYEPVLPEELPGFGEFAVGKGGVTDGLVMVNEMAAFKLPLDIYNEYMQWNHHYAPAEQDEKLTDSARQTREVLQAQATRSKWNDIGEGVDEGGLVDRMASITAPDFTESEQ